MKAILSVICLSVALQLLISSVQSATLNSSQILPYFNERFVPPACAGYCTTPSTSRLDASKPLREDDEHIKRAAKNGLNVGYLNPIETTMEPETLRARGMQARLTKSFLECSPSETGSNAYATRYFPPGGEEIDRIGFMDRGHLLARSLGGSGLEVLNIVAMHRRANRSNMARLETKVKTAFKTLELRDSDIIKYTVIPEYAPGRNSPAIIVVIADILVEGKQQTTYPWFSATFQNIDNPPSNVFSYDNTDNFKAGGIWVS